MNRLVREVCALLVLVLGLSLFLPAASHAAPIVSEGFNIITSPLPIKLSTSPGHTVSADLRLKNQGTESENIKVGLMKFGANGDLGQPNLADITPKDEYASWVHFSPSEFTAPPNVWLTVHMTIDVPPTAGLGYYLAVTFSRASQQNVKAANFKGAVATLVLLDVKSPNEKRSLNLVDFTTDHGLYEYLPATFNVKVHNNGNIHLSPAGNIFIERSGKPVSTITFNAAGGSVLPTSNRIFKVNWTDGFPVFKDKLVNGKPVPDKHDIPKRTLSWDFANAGKFRFGHYNAKLLVIYDNGSQDVPLESVVSFWVLPWKILLVLFIVLVLVGFGIWTASRSFFGKVRGGSKKAKTRKGDAKKP